MVKKHLTKEQKIKFVNICVEEGFEKAIVVFISEHPNRYSERSFTKNRKKNYCKVKHYLKSLLKEWLNLHNNDMKKIELKNKQNSKKDKQREVEFRELDEGDQKIIIKLYEDVMKDFEIPETYVQEWMKKHKEKIEEEKIKNHKKVCKHLMINRTSIYSNYVKKHIKKDKTLYINLYI